MIKQDATLFLKGRWVGAVASVLFWMLGLCFVLLAERMANYALALGQAAFPNQTVALQEGTLWVHPAFWVLCGVTLLCFLLLCPLEMGRAGWYLENTLGGREETATLFSCFFSPRLYFRSLWFGLQLTARRVLWGALFLFPSFSLSLGLEWMKKANAGPWVLAALGTAAVLAGGAAFVLYLFFIQRYALVRYSAVANRQLTCRKAMAMSKKAMKGNHAELLIAKCSFLPWWLLSLTVLPLLYTMPYYEMTLALYARYFAHKAEAPLLPAETPASASPISMESEGTPGLDPSFGTTQK